MKTSCTIKQNGQIERGTAVVASMLHGTDGPPPEIIAELSDEHAASSYGLPVIMIDGQAYGPADLPDGYIIVLNGRGNPDIEDLARRAKAAGYHGRWATPGIDFPDF